MGFRQRILTAAVAVCAALCAVPGHSLARDGQQSILMDDDQLIYATPQHMVQRLHQIASLGVDRVKVSVVWSLIAPHPNSRHRPRFDATDPAAYPPGAWDRYDLLVRTARSLGMGIYFQIDPPAPLWALPRGQSSKQGPQLGRWPVDSQLRQFAQAVGRRYNGTYVPASAASTAPPPSSPTTVPQLPAGVSQDLTASAPAWHSTAAHQAADPAGAAIPKVDWWGLWNEPNERSWLNPWSRSLGHRRTEELQPWAYRGIVDATWSGLQASGHAGDTILIGETANRGMITPVAFQLGLYCLNSRLQPLSGLAASEWGCPTRPNRTAFVRAHPGLFKMTGYAHHPYVLDAPPTHASPYPDALTLDNIGWTERRLVGIFHAYGISRPGGIPLYMTEWGYKTRPPNPYVHTSLAEQATWINQGEFMTWQSPYVAALAQFELVDSPPRTEYRKGTWLYWSSFQTGLILRNGHLKPSYQAFRIPIWLPSPRHGAKVTVWGQLRPADHSATQAATIQFKSRRGQWGNLRAVQTSSREGFLVAHVAIPAAGSVRIAWADPATGHVYISRSVPVS